jgi:hypothetical protein
VPCFINSPFKRHWQANGWQTLLVFIVLCGRHENSLEHTPYWETDGSSLDQGTHFREPESSRLCSQEPFAGPYPDPDELMSTPSHPISRRSILIHSLLSRSLPCGLLFRSSYRGVPSSKMRNVSLLNFYRLLVILLVNPWKYLSWAETCRRLINPLKTKRICFI